MLPVTCKVSRSYDLSFFFFNATSTPKLYTLSLHDALPIFVLALLLAAAAHAQVPKEADFVVKDFHFRSGEMLPEVRIHYADRKSTRLNSSHRCISYAVFCLKKKKAECSY